MSYYRTCPTCGANLDPGETCDCKEAAASAANTDGGGVEQNLAAVSTSTVTENGRFVK